MVVLLTGVFLPTLIQPAFMSPYVAGFTISPTHLYPFSLSIMLKREKNIFINEMGKTDFKTAVVKGRCRNTALQEPVVK